MRPQMSNLIFYFRRCPMKLIIYLLPFFILGIGIETTHAAESSNHRERIVLANNTVELDITMEMLDEDADSSDDIVHVIKLPVLEMHKEQIRNRQQIRQNAEETSPRREHDNAETTQGDIRNQMIDAQQEAAEAKRNAQDEAGQKKGH